MSALVKNKVGRPTGELYLRKSVEYGTFSLQCSDAVGWVTGRASGQQKVGIWYVGVDDLTGAMQYARHIAPVVITTSIILNSNIIQDGDILVPANSGPSGKHLAIKTEREKKKGRFMLIVRQK